MSAFNTWLRHKIVPGPIPGTQRWDRKVIDADVDRLSGLSSNPTMTSMSGFGSTVQIGGYTWHASMVIAK